jgi:arylsulfatase A-like enzyme/tetratricopeptide (TPR) repeat protein
MAATGAMMRVDRLEPRSAVALTLVLGLAFVSADGRPGRREASAAGRPNVLLVTIDTLRADRVGAYGAASPSTPTLDRLAKGGVLFEEATVDVPLTRPSHASILTGEHPFQHGIRDNFSFPLAPGHRTLAEELKARGYVTGGFVAAFMLNRQSGLGRGFDEFDDSFGRAGDSSTLLAEHQRRADEVEQRAGPWIERAAAGARPFFAWVHFYDPHSPYSPPPPYAARYARHPYDGEIAYTDSVLGLLMSRLDRLAIRDRTLVVVTSDHGEGLGEHGEAEHGFFVYDTTVRVPLIMRWPGVLPAGLRSRTAARSIDLVPTILDLTGGGPGDFRSRPGRSLAQALRAPHSELGDVVAYGETLFPRLHFECADLRSIRLGGWKYIEAPRPELYDLTRDPGERTNLFAREGPRARSLRSRLLDALGGSPESAVVGVASPALDADTLRRLASLGYVSGSGGGSGRGDPKDAIAEFQAYTRRVRGAFDAYDRNDLPSAILQFQAAIATGHAGFDVYYYLGSAHLRQGRPAQAVDPLRTAIQKLPTYAPAYLDLARAHLALGQRDAAAAVLRDGLSRDPDNFHFHSYLGFIARAGGDLVSAKAEYEHARALDPRDFDVRMNLSSVYRDAGNAAGALDEVDAALALHPDQADAHNQRGMLLGGAGRFADAAAAFDRASSLAPGNPQFWFNLGLARYRTGDRQSSAQALRRALRIKPDFGEARELLAEVEKAPDEE